MRERAGDGPGASLATPRRSGSPSQTYAAVAMRKPRSSKSEPKLLLPGTSRRGAATGTESRSFATRKQRPRRTPLISDRECPDAEATGFDNDHAAPLKIVLDRGNVHEQLLRL